MYDCMLFFCYQVAKQWYDFERSSFHFVKYLRELKEPLVFNRISDFDQNGIFYWIGTNARFVLYIVKHVTSITSPSKPPDNYIIIVL